MLARMKSTVISILFIVSVLALDGMAFQSNKPSPEAKQHYARARQLFALNETEKGLEELRAAIKLAPEYVEAHREFLDRQRDKAESFIAQYESYAKENPNSAAFQYLLGKAYSNANKREQSDAAFKKALELDPNYGWAMLAVGTIHSRNKETDRAIELWEKARKHAGDSLSLRATLASNLLNQKRFESVAQEAEQMLQLDPTYFEAYPTKWRAKLNLTLGSDETRAEVARDIKELESKHGKNVQALAVTQSGYQILDDEAGAARAKEAILAIDPKYFERQPSSFMIGTHTGKTVRLTGINARRFIDTFDLKDNHKAKIEIYQTMEKELDDMDAKLYAVYPAMIRSYISLKDTDNAERIVEAMVKGGIDAPSLAGHRIELARAYLESKTKLDTALEHARLAVEVMRQPPPKKPDGQPAGDPAEAAEFAKSALADALHLQGQILLEKGMTAQAMESLTESAKLVEQEGNTLDLGLVYAKSSKPDEAIAMFAKAYAFEGKRQQEAKLALEKIYGERSKTKPVAALLSEEVERHRLHMREKAITKVLSEIAKTEAKEAPQFTLATLSGQKVQLTDLRGKVVLLNFWATW